MIQTEGKIDKKELRLLLNRQNVAYGVIFYEPSESMIENCLRFLDYFSEIFIIDNSKLPQSHDALQSGIKAGRVHYRNFPENLGVGAALNQLCTQVLKNGYTWLLTMDQDSVFDEGHFMAYARAVDSPDLPERTGLFSVKHRREPLYEPAPEISFAACDAVMMSGNRVNLEAWKAVGGFCEKLFIDTVDHDFCLRLRRAGWEVLQFPFIYIGHSLGALKMYKKGNRILYRIEHSPERLYYITRNNLRLWGLYGREFREFIHRSKAHYFKKRLYHMIFHESHKLKRIGLVLRGVADYCLGRYGKL